MHEAILQALQSSHILAPQHVKVTNESYVYSMRKRMGSKKHGAMIVKLNASSLRWESFIFKMKVREEDMEVVPKRMLVSHHKTKWAATKACDVALKERDANPAKIAKMAAILDLKKIQSTHFRVSVVSSAFDHLDTVDRLCLVYEELLSKIGTSVVPVANPLGLKTHVEAIEGDVGAISALETETEAEAAEAAEGPVSIRLGTCAPTGLKMGSVFGANMCELGVFRFLLPADGHPLHLMVDTRTPSQWKPDLFEPPLSERHGLAHVDLRASQIAAAAQPRGQKMRIKKLTTVVSEQMLHQLDLQTNHGGKKAEAAGGLAESLGLHDAVSGVKYKKLGGIYGHFFNDLSPAIKELVMSKYKDNKTLIRDESNTSIMDFHKVAKEQAHKDMHQPKTTMSMMRAKQEASAVSGEYDKGTATEHEMFEEVSCANFRMERAALRLQRVRRMYLWHRAVKWSWWRQYAAITLQRLVRAHFGRQYARLYRSLRPRAATRIQRSYRDSRSRAFYRVWQWLVYRLTRTALPKIKRFIRNCFLSWIARRNIFAVRIQKVCRGFLGRAVYLHRVGERHYGGIFPPAALTIQKLIRGYLGRSKVEAYIESVLRVQIDIPAAIRLQRIYRGRLGKKVLARLRVEFAALLFIQRIGRRFVHRIWDNEVYVAKVQKSAATNIQRCYRGTLDRELHRLLAHVRWYTTIYMPAIILVQSVTRRHRARKYVMGLIARKRSALYLEKKYIDYCDRKLAKMVIANLAAMKKFRAASKLQKNVRRMQALQYFRRKCLEYKGRITMAAKIIMRAWQACVLTKRYRHLLDEHRRKMYHHKIVKYIENRTDIQQDIKEVIHDISIASKAILRLKDRAHMVETFQAQASIRSGTVKREMGALQVEDFERGWAEALGGEYETLSYQIQLSTEELRLLRYHARKRQREVLDLQLELEEFEQEMDTIEVVEMETTEGLRRAELAIIDRDVNFKRSRDIRREKSHWRIVSDRKRVIQRERPRFQAIVAATQTGRDLKYASTVSYERHAREWDVEQLLQEKLLAEDARKQDEENKPKTYGTSVLCPLPTATTTTATTTIPLPLLCHPPIVHYRYFTCSIFQCSICHLPFIFYQFITPFLNLTTFPPEPLNTLTPSPPYHPHPRRYLEYGGPVQSTYDRVVHNSLDLLRGMTLDERARRLREQAKAKEVKKRKATKGQFGALKEENELRRTFDRYK